MRHELAPDQMIATLAARQFGVVSRSQLLEIGLSESAIARARRSGRLHRLYRGVYASGTRC
jgi:Transcriptional regulator, AbiEi antitoxin